MLGYVPSSLSSPAHTSVQFAPSTLRVYTPQRNPPSSCDLLGAIIYLLLAGGNCVMVHRYASWRGSCAWGSRESSTHGDYGQKTQARVPVLVPVRRPSRLGTGRSDDSACKYTHIPLTLSAERHSWYSYPPIHTMHLRAPSLFLFAQQGGTDRRSRPDVQGLAGPWMRTRPFSNESMANNTVGRYRRPGRALRPCVSPRLNALYVHRPAPCRS